MSDSDLREPIDLIGTQAARLSGVGGKAEAIVRLGLMLTAFGLDTGGLMYRV